MPVRMNFDVDGLDEVTSALQEIGVEVVPLTRREIFNSLLAVRNKLTFSPPRPTYPINWDSERQRRAFFASGGFGGGIPTRRTGRHQRAWRVVRALGGYAIENPEPSAVYLYGDEDSRGQSRIHQNRWPLYAPFVERAVNEIPDKAEAEIQKLAEKKGF